MRRGGPMSRPSFCRYLTSIFASLATFFQASMSRALMSRCSIPGDEVGGDAECQQFLDDVRLGQRCPSARLRFLCDRKRGTPAGRIHHPGQAPFEIDALLLVARNVRQARGSFPADRKRLQLSIFHQRRPGRHVDQPHRDVPAHQVVGEFRRAAERDMLRARRPAFWERISPQKCPVEPTPQLPYWIGSPFFDSSIRPSRSLAAKSFVAMRRMDDVPIRPMVVKSLIGS